NKRISHYSEIIFTIFCDYNNIDIYRNMLYLLYPDRFESGTWDKSDKKPALKFRQNWFSNKFSPNISDLGLE
ncbi:MAG: hypothetical protein AB7S77_24685, partial [Desulfatirhabdiaceae bacterium]